MSVEAEKNETNNPQQLLSIFKKMRRAGRKHVELTITKTESPKGKTMPTPFGVAKVDGVRAYTVGPEDAKELRFDVFVSVKLWSAIQILQKAVKRQAQAPA